jgi:periplasmic protein TonB
VTAAAKGVLLAGEDLALRRWAVAAALVAAVHAGLIVWLMRRPDAGAAGAPPAAILIDLPPLDVLPPAEAPPDATPGPQMNEAPPEQTAPQPATAAPELPPAQRPAAVMLSPQKAKPKPKKVVKEAPKPVPQRTHEPAAPQASAPKHSEAARGQTAAAPRENSAGSAASAASWRAQIFAHLLQFRPGGGDAAGTVSISFTLARNGRLLASRLVGSSGSSALDAKALEMVRRANPFPAAPSEVSGGTFPFVVPVRFR